MLIELLCFLPIMRKVGFYFDDWATLCQLFFGPKEQGLWGLMQNYAVHNSLVIIRPIEALHFGTVFWFFGVNPLPWHAVNIGLEIIVGLLTCAIVRRLCGSEAVAFFAAAFVLLCPSHDSSHYWIVCSSVSLSFALYLASLLATIESVSASKSSSRLLLQLLASLLFALSLFNYETFMPLAVVNIMVVVFLRMDSALSLKTVASAVVRSLPTVASMALPVVSLVCYLKLIVPRISAASMREIHFDPQVFLSTICSGVELHFPVTFARFVFARAFEGLQGLTLSEVARIILIGVVILGCLLFHAGCKRSRETNEGEKNSAFVQPHYLTLVGLVAVAISYTIFGLSPDYSPTFMTYLNRINTGASFGVALILAGAWSYLSCKYDYCRSIGLPKLFLMQTIPTLLLLTFALADLGLSKPWIASWATQKHIQEQIVRTAEQWPSNASVLLMNCPRYVMWAPVYDGVWDFRNTVQIILNRPDFKAGVVSERLLLNQDGLSDISRGIVCGTYPFSSLLMLAAPSCRAIRVENAEQFVQVVEREGMGFGLEREALKVWQEKAREIKGAKP